MNPTQIANKLFDLTILSTKHPAQSKAPHLLQAALDRRCMVAGWLATAATLPCHWLGIDAGIH
jgi:hypothetical protein